MPQFTFKNYLKFPIYLELRNSNALRQLKVDMHVFCVEVIHVYERDIEGKPCHCIGC